jgi:hypothetical protein
LRISARKKEGESAFDQLSLRKRHTVTDATLHNRSSVGKTEGSAGEGNIGDLHYEKMF